MDNYHITKDGKQWKLKKEGSERASKTAVTKKEIIDQTNLDIARKGWTKPT